MARKRILETPSNVSASVSTRDQIAEVALAILEAEGPAAVTMRRVAEAVGITPMAIYHHFPNREALLDTITNQEFAHLLSYIELRPNAKKSSGSAENQLISKIEFYVNYAFDRPRIFDYVFAESRPNARRYPEDFRARLSPTFNPLVDLLAKLMKAGEIRKDDPYEVALAIWAHTHGYISLYRAGRFNLTEDQFRALVRRSLRRFIHGLKGLKA